MRAALCNHIDVMGCAWNMPGNYNPSFDACQRGFISGAFLLLQNSPASRSTCAADVVLYVYDYSVVIAKMFLVSTDGQSYRYERNR